MDEFGQGGISRSATTGSASTRSSASSRATRSSPSVPTRERMRSSASSTVITPPLYRGAAGRAGLAPLVEAAPVPSHHAIAAQDEESEEARGDEDLAEPDGKEVGVGDGRIHQQHALQEHRDPAHEEDDHERLVRGGRAAGEALEKVGER